MAHNIGSTHWAIAEGYIPSDDPNKPAAFISHETCCILNAGQTDANVEVMIYFSDRDPVGPYRFKVKAQRTSHLRFNDFTDPAPLPRDTEYSSTFISDVPVVIQHTRLDSRKETGALLSTIAFAQKA